MPNEKLLCIKLSYDQALLLTVEDAAPLLSILARNPIHKWYGYGVDAIYSDCNASLEMFFVDADRVQSSLTRMIATAAPALPTAPEPTAPDEADNA